MDKLLADLQAATKLGRAPIAQLSPQDRHSIDDAKAAQASLDQRMKALEAAIMADPVKAVSLR